MPLGRSECKVVVLLLAVAVLLMPQCSLQAAVVTKPVKDWSVDEVVDWLPSVGLGQVCGREVCATEVACSITPSPCLWTVWRALS